MKTFERSGRPPKLVIAVIAALGLTAVLTTPLPALAGHGDDIVVPDLPPNLPVEPGNKVFLVGHAEGTQNYICMPCPNKITDADHCPASGFAWAFFGPQATLFDVADGDDDQIITHFNSPNPDEGGKERPSWQSSRDSSAVWGNNTPPALQSSTDAKFVADHSIAWLTLPAVGTQVGPTGGDKLANVTFIQRLNTHGGVAPDPSTCSAPEHSGTKALQHYSADYFFYKKAK